MCVYICMYVCKYVYWMGYRLYVKSLGLLIEAFRFLLLCDL